MTVFWLTLAIVFICGYFARMVNNASAIDSVTQSKPNKFFAFIAITVLILVSGLRSNIGDTGTYIDIFVRSVPENMTDAFEEFTLYSGDSGFNIFQSFIKTFFSTDPQVLIFICALITNLLIFMVIYKYSTIFELSLFLYIATGCYLVTMNGVRQYLVSAILFFCVKLIIDGKWLSFLIITLLVSTIHMSALTFIPVYFFVRLKPWSKWVSIILFSSVVILLLFNQIGTFLLGSLEGTQYSHYEEDILEGGGGANIIRVFVAAIPIVLAYLGRKRIEEQKDKSINIFINLSVLNVVFYILAVQNWIFARMCMYFGLYGLLLLPWLITNLFDKRTSEIFYGSCLISYLIYYYYEMVPSLHIVYRSDFIGF
jgi:transmembrane protein EpsG